MKILSYLLTLKFSQTCMNFTNIDFHRGRKKKTKNKTILRKSMGVTLSAGGELEIPKWSFIYTQCEQTINKQTKT